MRVIAGSAKGRRLKVPRGLKIRPTTDRIKESIFSIITPYISDSIVLDLFSGTGSLGIEALSRGAERTYFVDNNRNSIKIIRENIQHAGFISKSELCYSDALKAIKDFALQEMKFDIIFMDPPYLKGIVIPCMMAINEGKILSKDAIIVVEYDSKDIIPNSIGNLVRIKEKKYGNTTISMYAEEA